MATFRLLLWESGRCGGAALFHGLNQRLPAHCRPRAVATFHDLFVFSGDYSSPDFRARFAAQARAAAGRPTSRATCPYEAVPP